MLIHDRQRWSAAPVSGALMSSLTSGTPLLTSASEHSTHMKWRAFLFSLILFVFLEVAIVMYVGLGTASRLTAVRPSPVSQPSDVVRDLRLNLGLVNTGNGTNESMTSSVFYDNASIPYAMFAEYYGQFCDKYFIPRTINAERHFAGVFDRIAARVRHHRPDGQTAYGQLNDTERVDNTVASNHSSGDGKTRDLCPCVPGGLHGAINISMEVPYVGELELKHPDILPGGHWRPRDCLARHRTAIIIPFRDREEHLRILLNYLHPMLQRQMLYYTIFVIEQAYPAVFNKASIMNVGFREASLVDSFDCFIFHDVDMIPENDYNFYTCTAQPRHVGSHCDKFGYKVPYPNIFGGVTAFTSKQFIKANGFSNEFYGWGGEDDDMFQRIKASGMRISRFPGNIARYTMIKHGSDAGNPYNSRSYVAWQSRPDHYRRNGISQLRYYRRQRELRPLYTWYLIELPDPSLSPNVVQSEKKSAASRLMLNVPSSLLLLAYISLALLAPM